MPIPYQFLQNSLPFEFYAVAPAPAFGSNQWYAEWCSACYAWHLACDELLYEIERDARTRAQHPSSSLLLSLPLTLSLPLPLSMPLSILVGGLVVLVGGLVVLVFWSLESASVRCGGGFLWCSFESFVWKVFKHNRRLCTPTASRQHEKRVHLAGTTCTTTATPSSIARERTCSERIPRKQQDSHSLSYWS